MKAPKESGAFSTCYLSSFAIRLLCMTLFKISFLNSGHYDSVYELGMTWEEAYQSFKRRFPRALFLNYRKARSK